MRNRPQQEPLNPIQQKIRELASKIEEMVQDDEFLSLIIRETGHTDAMHVGLPDIMLVERVEKNEKTGALQTASTFFDDAAKLKAIRETVIANKSRIARFLLGIGDKKNRDQMDFSFTHDKTVGKGYDPLFKEKYSKTTDVVIERSSTDRYPFRIKTAYPFLDKIPGIESVKETGFHIHTTSREYNALSPLEKTRNDIKVKYDLDHVHISRDGEILRVAMMNGDDPLGFKGQHNDQDYIDYMYLTADGAICFGIEQDGELVFVPMEIMAEHCPDGVEMMQEIQQEYGERFLLDHTQEQDREETKERDYRNFDDWLH